MAANTTKDLLKSDKLAHKVNLAETVKKLNKGKICNFAFGSQVDHFDFKMFQVEDLGYIKVPVSLANVAKLKKNSKEAPYGKGKNKIFDSSVVNYQEIDSFKVLSTMPASLALSSLIIHQLGLPRASMDIEAKLEKLVIYETGGHNMKDYNIEKTFGKFGTAVLQIPVEGGHEGGCIKIEYKENEKMFATHVNSDQRFYLSAFYGNATHLVEPVTRGWKIALVFSLLWKNAKTDAPYDFPILIAALKEMEDALLPWIPHQKVDSTNENGADIPMKVDELVSVSARQASRELSSKENLNENNEDDELDDSLSLDNDTLKDHILYFVLKEKYDANDLTFNRLRGEDRNLAHLLQSCKFLDVHLALVTLKSLNEEHNGWSRCSREMLSTKISRWIDSKDVIRDLNVKLNWQKQRVGPIRKLLSQQGMNPDREKRILHKAQEDWEKEDKVDEEIDEDSNIDRIPSDMDVLMLLLSGGPSEEEEEDFVVRTKYFDNFVLVIWPKQQSFHMYSHYGFRSLLDNMENSLNTAEEKDLVRQDVTRDLQKVVSFCCEKPNVVWNKWGDDEKKNDVTCRLLRLCVALRACEEGLYILKLLGSKVVLSGTKIEEVARVIADFECQVTGWDACAGVIKEMLFTSKRIVGRFRLLTELAQCFLDVSCFEGAKMIGDGISSSLVTIDQLEMTEVEPYAHLLISLECEAKTSNQERMKSLVAFFPKLGPSELCDILLSLELSPGSQSFKILDSFQFLLEELYKTITTSQLVSNDHIWSIKRQIIQLLRCYIRRGNAELLRSMFSKVCEPATLDDEYAERLNSLKFELPGKIMSSSEFWEFVNLAELQQSAPCLECYRDACRLFFTKDFVSLVKSSGDLATKIVNCLVSLNDEVCWQSFVNQICASFATKKNDIFVRVFLENVEFKQSLLNSTSAFSFFNQIVNHWEEQWKSYKEPPFSWQRKANMSNPEIDAFLSSSDQETMTYVKEKNIGDVRYYARRIRKKGLKNGYRVVIKSKKNKKEPRCVIIKDKSFHKTVVQDFQNRKSDFEAMSKLRQSICAQRENLENGASAARMEVDAMM